jgi:CRP/FNR family transcriptional regulator, dissimilatory nitrate respiration regulator
MENILHIISTIPLFDGLPQDQLEEIRQIAIGKLFGKNEIIFSEGDTANGFYLVVDGKVKVFKASSEGKEQILHILGPGEPFGEVPVFSGKSFPANAQALAKSHLLFFPRLAFVNLITAHPSLALNMLAMLSMRLRQFTVQVEHLSLKEVPGRLAAYLICLSEEQEKNTVNLTISKGQLASLLGTIPETLSRIFARMSERNLIEVSGKTITITDRLALEELASDGRLL